MKFINVDPLHVVLIAVLFGVILVESSLPQQLPTLLNWIMILQLLVGALKEILPIGLSKIVGDNLGEKPVFSELKWEKIFWV